MNPQERQQALIDKLDTDTVDLLHNWRTNYADLSPRTREAYDLFNEARGQTHIIARTAAERIRQLRSDDMSNPEGVQRTLDEVRAQTAAQLSDLRQRQEAALVLLRGTLTVHALPAVDPAREMAARDELRMMLDASAEPEMEMAELVQRGGELGAVITSSWGESYLRARGVKQAPAVHNHVRTVALAANTQHADPRVRAAAEGLLRLTDLEKARDATTYITNNQVEAAG